MSFLTTTEARKRLHISKEKMARLIYEGKIPTHEDPLDSRKKLINEHDLQPLLLYRPQATQEQGP